MVIVRDLVTSDEEGWLRVRRAALPFLPLVAGQVRHDLEHSLPQEHRRFLVAEEDGEMIATAEVGIAHDSPEPGQGYCNVHTHPERTGRGAGSLLAAAAEEHLAGVGASAVYAWVLDGPGSLEFARRRGYTPSRTAHFLRRDLVDGPPLPRRPPPDGVEVRSAADFAADPRPLFEADAETTADEPSDVPASLDDYAQWLDTTWRHPAFDHHLTSVVTVDGTVAAFSVGFTDGLSRYGSGMTGTRRAFRGRGLAKLAKTASLRRARALGCTEAFTGNDAGNGPMLAVNEALGYEICATEVRHVRTLG
ncbi:GNAT family N-acetyltransferase [uncultured Streptomyces sp.]|uniref:GNAT family N-acetyltransferase n=1 Tax=uncultured Streptomyces sp. TaxID=174707 RepID=UPI002632634F|nr:GNAT family N-acetyltransferase [uncultured Streptomyces sp.]